MSQNKVSDKHVRANVLQFATRQNASLKVGEVHHVLINREYVTLEQFELAQRFMKHYGKNLLTRRELILGSRALTSNKCSPYFMSKNAFVKVEYHLYDLSRLKCHASAAKACENFDAIKAIASDVTRVKSVQIIAANKAIKDAKVKRVRSTRAALKQIAACDAMSTTVVASNDASEDIAHFDAKCAAIVEDDSTISESITFDESQNQ